MDDLNAGNIHRDIYSWVGYDLEQQGSGPTYPTDEEYPVEYLQLFGQLAHFNGFSCVALPGMDLGNTALDPAKTSGTNEEWYENNQIALVCGQYFDAMVCQAQSLQNTYSSWQSLISNSSGQFASPFDEGTTEWPNVGNAAGIFFGELSTSISGTSAALMEDCWTEGSFTPPAACT